MLTGEQLKMLRIRFGLLQTDVATAYGCTKQYISNIENGIERFHTEDSYKKYVNAIYKAQAMKQQGQMPKYNKDYDKIYRQCKKELLELQKQQEQEEQSKKKSRKKKGEKNVRSKKG